MRHKINLETTADLVDIAKRLLRPSDWTLEHIDRTIYVSEEYGEDCYSSIDGDDTDGAELDLTGCFLVVFGQDNHNIKRTEAFDEEASKVAGIDRHVCCWQDPGDKSGAHYFYRLD